MYHKQCLVLQLCWLATTLKLEKYSCGFLLTLPIAGISFFSFFFFLIAESRSSVPQL